MPISILVADDHPIVRRGMQSLFESESDFSIAGVAADGLETVLLTERLKPDVLVLDLMMPGLSGLEVLRILRERAPRTRIVILSMYSSIGFVAQALQGGAIGYVLKGIATCYSTIWRRTTRCTAVLERSCKPANVPRRWSSSCSSLAGNRLVGPAK